MLGLFTGLRLASLADLRWDQFSDDYSTLQVVVKGGKALTLPVVEQLADELRSWRRLCWVDGVAVIPKIKEKYGEHFRGERNKALLWDQPLGAPGIYAAVKKAGGQIGLEIRPHDMRRSFAGWLEEQGLDLRAIQGLLGHENIATTAGYLERNPARLRRATEGLRRSL
jgi:integrase